MVENDLNRFLPPAIYLCPGNAINIFKVGLNFFFSNITDFADNTKLDYYKTSLENLYQNQDVKNYIKGKKAEAVVIHYLDENCSCSKFSKYHIEKLENRYKSNGIIYLNISEKKDQKLNGKVENIFSLKNIPASPAVAIFNSEGDLSYFGPYSDDYFCGTDADSFAEKSINKILAGKKFSDFNLLTAGCFCKSEV